MKDIKELFKGKQAIKISVVLVILTALSFFICADFDKNTDFTTDAAYNIDLNSVTAYNYVINGTTFTPSNTDPQIHISSPSGVANRVSIKLSAPLEQTTYCQIFYPDEYGNISENDSRKIYAPTKSNEIIFSIPEASYSFFRIDIDGSFSVDSISVQKVTANSHIVGMSFNFIAFILLFLVSCALSLVLVAYEKHVLLYARVTVKKPWFLRLIISLLFGLVMFHLLSGFWNQPWFVSDEAEIFMHGQAIANGELLYKDTASQHTPIMYYISAVFSLLGVKTITGFRLCFYGVIAALWALMYFRYSERRGKIALFLYPILYVCILAQLEFTATCILSDQFQGLGMAILFFEFLEFNEKRELGIPNCVMISLSILISFGAAFVSAFAIGIMAMTVVALDVWRYVKEKTEIKQAWSELWRRYVKLFSIVLAPMMLICFFYLVTGSLDDFIAWAYTINRTVYINYTGGYGASITDGFFGGRVHFINLLKINGLNVATFSKLLILLLAVSYIVSTVRKGNGAVIRVGGLILFMLACATRGLYDFHGLSAVALMCAMAACFIGEELLPAIKSRALPIAATALCAIVIVTPYYQNIYPNTKKITLENDVPMGSTAWYVDKLTEDGERVGFSLLNCDVMVLGRVIPATVQAGSVPWFWDFAGEEAMAELNQDAPRLFLFSSSHEVWGHKITDYAPELVAFIESNYTSLDYIGQPAIWVHNSYIGEVNQNISNGSYFIND